MSLHISTDVGGTFTDLVLYDYDPKTLRGELRELKVDTTPPNFERGVLDAIARCGADLSQVALLAHGTTVVINALTERRGARTALVTTRGFRDVLEIGRGNRPDLFNLNFTKPVPFVERYLRAEVTERMTHLGKLQTPVATSELDAIAESFRKEGVEAIAVCCLHAYRNPENEKTIADTLRRLLPGVPVVASHEISREWREYERTNTTVVSAFVSPVVRKYVGALRAALDEQAFSGNLYLMQSNGGMTSSEGAIANPVSMVESGPASGMIAAQALGQLIGEANLIALDVGGTTAKCTLIHNGHLSVTTEYHIERTAKHPGYPIQTAVIELVEIGQGGGSIASVDAGGRLQVGPQSAGASPGPVAYGRGGTRPTTTDANLLLGRIDAAHFLGGQVTPDLKSVRASFARLGQPLGLGEIEAAQGVLRLANANMVNALKLVSTNKGYDPRDFTLMAFGGGGALHALELAEELHIPRVIIPTHAAVFSAWGMLLTDIRRDYTLTDLRVVAPGVEAALRATYAAMEEQARNDFASQAMNQAELRFAHYADLRYLGQEHTVKVPVDLSALDSGRGISAIVDRFHTDHETRYTYRLPDAGVEVVNFHLVASVHIVKPKPQLRQTGAGRLEDAHLGTRSVFFEHDGSLDVAIYDNNKLEPGMCVVGPAIIQDASSSVVLPPRHKLGVDSYGNLIIDLQPAPQPEVA
ncbi:MAG: hydantoinase/oxoprolinase family protein [Sterolibacterium sp.]|jgi:N-methylhydantoinase A